ncbi:methyl-CpG-binding domain-containing protein 13-like isoform X2 [Actinidia eriantha]|uniref:methyl-CpG-binding domain-containing protein 13-like isoform X2 n=1 Tax=Actinidia eriantha TaxID=165200 RepID=UPI0025866EA7|nr:methyl-CpG-binding domain-containing protein 13-like isoform X2 [Actinidia eriantha]
MVAGKSPDWLPAGWTEHVKVNNGRKVKCYIDPLTGRKFYSKPQVSEYLRTVKDNSSTPQKKKIGLISVSNPNMGEIIGGETFLKQEGSPNGKTPKRMSCASKRKQMGFSMQSLEKVAIETVTPDGLPPGWIKETYYTDPASGYVFCSQQDALCYLETGDFSKCTIKPRKRNGLGFLNEESSVTPNVGELTEGETSHKQDVKTLRLTRHASKQKQIGCSKQSVEKPNVGELTRGETSLNQDGPQNFRTPVRTRCASKQNQIGSSKQSVEQPNMDGSIGGETSLKLDQPENGKSLKPTSRASTRKQTGSSKEPIEEMVVVRVTPDGLPPGWIKEIKIQKKANGTRKDSYYTDPVSGYVFLSQKDALRFVETGDVNICSVKPKKRDELHFLNASPNLGELTGGETSLKQEGSPNVKTPKRQSCVSKHKQMGFAKESIGKVAIERATPNGLPPGWIKEIKIQKKANGIRKYAYYIDPVSGYVFWSQKDAFRYLETGDVSSCTIKPKKRDGLVLNEGTSLSPNMGELTGGITCPKQEESQNVITQKPSKRKRMGFTKQSSDKVVIERVTPDGLPPGWIKEIKIQKKANGTRKDTYYTDPVSGYVFFSQKDALRYSETGDLCKCSMKPKKRDELNFLNEVASPNMGELTEGKTSLELEGSQNVITPKNTSSASNSKEKPRGITKQSVEKIVIERVTPVGLPPGWIKEIRIQMKENGTRKDPYYTDPVSGYVFGSQKDALRYLETGDIRSCSIKPRKREEFRFLNEQSSLPAVAITQKLGDETTSEPFTGTQNNVASILGTAEAVGPQKRRWTTVSADENEESADTEESYDPSYTPRSSTKISKRKRGKRESAENGTASSPSTPILLEKSPAENGKGKKSNRKTQSDPSKSNNEKALDLPTRTSKRFLESEMVADSGLSELAGARKTGEGELYPSVGPLLNVARSIPQPFQTASEAEMADNALIGTEARSNVQHHSVPEHHTVRRETEKNDEETQDQKNPFGDSWSDPCLEFAFKALSGEIPVEDNLPIPIRNNSQQQTDSSCAQTANPLSDSAPQLPMDPTFIPPGFVGLPSYCAGAPQQPKLETDKEHRPKADS